MMDKQINGDILLSALEVGSLTRVLTSVNRLLAALPSYGGDLLGNVDDFHALCMWEDVLAGQDGALSWYIDDDDEEEDEEEEEESMPEPQTVLEWLAAHGKEERRP